MGGERGRALQKGKGGGMGDVVGKRRGGGEGVRNWTVRQNRGGGGQEGRKREGRKNIWPEGGKMGKGAAAGGRGGGSKKGVSSPEVRPSRNRCLSGLDDPMAKYWFKRVSQAALD